MRNRRTYIDTSFKEATEQCRRAGANWKSVYREEPLTWWPVLRPGKAIDADPDGWRAVACRYGEYGGSCEEP